MIAEILNPTIHMVTQRMQHDQALSAKDPDKETKNEGAKSGNTYMDFFA